MCDAQSAVVRQSHRLPWNCPSSSSELCNQIYANPEVRYYSYTCESDDGNMRRVVVQECMPESTLCYLVPCALMRRLIEDYSCVVGLLQDSITTLPLESECDEQLRAAMITDLGQYLDCCQQQYRRLLTSCATELHFKASAQKANAKLSLVPINYHAQLLSVLDDVTSPSVTSYRLYTVGAFAAHHMGFDNGGTASLSSSGVPIFVNRQYIAPAPVNLVKSALRLNSVLISTRRRLIASLARFNDSTAENAAHALGQEAADAPTLDLSQSPIVLFESIKHDLDLQELLDDFWQSIRTSSTNDSTNSDDIDACSSPASWDYHYSSFVESVSRLHSEALDDTARRDDSKHEEHLAQAYRNVAALIGTLQRAAVLKLVRNSSKPTRSSCSLFGNLIPRFDSNFSNALAAITSALASEMCHRLLNDADGIDDWLTPTDDRSKTRSVLFQIECLLSCHGIERAMLDDMIVAVQALRDVVWIVQLGRPSGAEDEEAVKVDLCRDDDSGYPLVHLHFRLDDCVEKTFRIQPVFVLFNIGINEQATLAETIGDTSLQVALNAYSARLLIDFVGAAVNRVDSNLSDADENQLRQLTERLVSETIDAGAKSKNVAVLELAADICRLVDGVRMTLCKSAKDRTAMSCTLEQAKYDVRLHA